MARYLKPLRCPSCRTEFRPKRSAQTTCSTECAAVARERAKKRKLKQRQGAIAQLASFGTLETLGNTQEIEGQNAQASPSPWTAPVKSPGAAVVARSVTRAKPLSEVERGALALATPGLSEAMPKTVDRAALIRNAVECELGHTFPAKADESIPYALSPLFGREGDYEPTEAMPDLPAFLKR